MRDREQLAREWWESQEFDWYSGDTEEEIIALLVAYDKAIRPDTTLDLAEENQRLKEQADERNFLCAARHSDMGANDPQDCDWPVCGCDQYADKVIEALQESGALADKAELTQLRSRIAELESVLREWQRIAPLKADHSPNIPDHEFVKAWQERDRLLASSPASAPESPSTSCFVCGYITWDTDGLCNGCGYPHPCAPEKGKQ